MTYTTLQLFNDTQSKGKYIQNINFKSVAMEQPFINVSKFFTQYTLEKPNLYARFALKK